uniref:Uncharacterized protein n=1 Tax=Cacopsylla melanoneura TaxID=428564 RepID=A0A8D8TFP7_9HEMI
MVIIIICRFHECKRGHISRSCFLLYFLLIHQQLASCPRYKTGIITGKLISYVDNMHERSYLHCFRGNLHKLCVCNGHVMLIFIYFIIIFIWPLGSYILTFLIFSLLVGKSKSVFSVLFLEYRVNLHIESTMLLLPPF